MAREKAAAWPLVVGAVCVGHAKMTQCFVRASVCVCARLSLCVIVFSSSSLACNLLVFINYRFSYIFVRVFCSNPFSRTPKSKPLYFSIDERTSQLLCSFGATSQLATLLLLWAAAATADLRDVGRLGGLLGDPTELL